MGTCNACASKADTKPSLNDPSNPQNLSNHSEARIRKKSSTNIVQRAELIQEKTGSIMKDYKIFPNVIGKGTFSEVRKAIHQASGEMRAIKLIKIDKDHPDVPKHVRDELEILKKLDHPYIIMTYEYFFTKSACYIITDYIQGKPLFDYILSAKLELNEKLIAEIMRQLMTAVNYIHGQGVLHRDIKSHNLLFDGKQITMIDFGLSVMVKKGSSIKTNVVGTQAYLAPESLEGQYSEKSDVWACGALLYMLLTGQAPFEAATDVETIEKIKKCKFNIPLGQIPATSDNVRDLLIHMLEQQPKARFTAAQCIAHPFLQTKDQVPSDPEAFRQATERLRQRFHQGQLQEILYSYFVEVVLSKHEQDQLTEAFTLMDKNRDGVLSKEELKIGLENAGRIYSEEELNDIFDKIDTDNSGTITFHEYLMATFDREKVFHEERIRKLFYALGAVRLAEQE